MEKQNLITTLLFDGVWGIWDDPFFQYTKTSFRLPKRHRFSPQFSPSPLTNLILSQKNMKGYFQKETLPMHQCVGYTDFAFKQFFEAAKKEPWFQNTIFIITADHTNQIRYKRISESQ